MDVPPASKLKGHGRIAFPRRKRRIASIAVTGEDLRLNNSSGEAFITSLERREQTEVSHTQLPQISSTLLSIQCVWKQGGGLGGGHKYSEV